MTTANEKIAAMVKEAVEKATASKNDIPSWGAAPCGPLNQDKMNAELKALSEADKIAEPLVAELKNLGHIPQDASWYVEWDGAFEFGLICVFWGDEGEHCLNAHPDGDVCVFA